MQWVCAILSYVACPALQYFSTFSHERHDLKKKLLNTKCVFWFSVQHLSETFLILGRNERDMTKQLYWSSCKVPILLSDFNETWIFSTDFRKDFHIPNFMKIRPVGVELSHEDGQTERHYDANSRFFAILRKLLKSCKTISSRCLCVLAFQILTNWPIFNTTNANLMPLMATTRPCFFQFPKTGHNKKNVVTTEAGTTTEMM